MGNLGKKLAEGKVHFTNNNPPPRFATIVAPTSTHSSFEAAQAEAKQRNGAAAAKMNAWQARVRAVHEANRREIQRTNEQNYEAKVAAAVDYQNRRNEAATEALEERPVVGHATSLQNVSNPGQLAIIQDMGISAFAEVSRSLKDAGPEASESNEAETAFFTEALKAQTAYPEAVEHIFALAAEAMAETNMKPVHYKQPQVHEPNIKPIPKAPKVQLYGAGEVIIPRRGRR